MDGNVTHVSVDVPCAAIATVCVQIEAYAPELMASALARVTLDGAPVEDEGRAIVDGRHVCVKHVGCGPGGAQRTVTVL